MICHRTPLGHEAAVRTGMSRSRGEVVMIRDQGHRYRVLAQRPQPPTQPAATSQPGRPNYLSRLQGVTPGR